MLEHIPIQLKFYFYTMFKYMMIHLIFSWHGFPIFYNDKKKTTNINFKNVQSNKLGFC
jgi:hypothetical protein